jgi:hypothetical protein
MIAVALVVLVRPALAGNGAPASSTLGFGARYDLNDTYRLLGYVRRGIQNTNETDQYSWYASVLFTF